jgi:hypothetical protein
MMRTLRPTDAPPQLSADEALRQLFDLRASEVAAAPDIAGLTVARARRISRRRMSIGGIAAVMAFLVTLGTAVSLRGWWLPEGASGASGRSGVAGPGSIDFDAPATRQAYDNSPVNLDIDVVVDNRIFNPTTDRWVAVGDTEPDMVVRVENGWLAGDSSGIRLVEYNGVAHTLAPAQTAWAVNADGTQIATLNGTTLTVREVTLQEPKVVASTKLPAGEKPVGFVASTVVLMRKDGTVDAWRPNGSLEASDLTYVYSSTTSDTVGLIASPGSGRPCLATVSGSVVGFSKVSMAGCNDDFAQSVGHAAVSPNGDYIAVPYDGEMSIIDVSRSVAAFAQNPAAGPVGVATCAADGDATPVWQNPRTVVTSAHGSIIACGVDGLQRDVKLPPDVNGSARLVTSRM